MDDNRDFEQQWRDWSTVEPKFDENQLKRELLERIPEKRSRRTPRLVLVAAAASMLALLIGYESARKPETSPSAGEKPQTVYDTSENVIVVLRADSEPIFVLTEPSASKVGEMK